MQRNRTVLLLDFAMLLLPSNHAASRISANFFRRDRALIAASRFKAELRLAWASSKTSTTGSRLRVYREAVPALCCWQRRSTSLAMPVYSESSVHLTKLTNHPSPGGLQTSLAIQIKYTMLDQQTAPETAEAAGLVGVKDHGAVRRRRCWPGNCTTRSTRNWSAPGTGPGTCART